MTEVEEEVLLTALDRCDRCGAAAMVRAVAEWGELLFCGHHYKANDLPLAAAGARIYDQRPMIDK